MRGSPWAPALFLLFLTGAATAQDSGSLGVTVRGELPGIPPHDLASYLARIMDGAGLSWHFAAAAESEAPANRIEWRFWPNPYAGGASRYLGPGRSTAESLFGIHRLMSVEGRLFKGGQYQLLVFGQIEVKGGRNDAEFERFIRRETKVILTADEEAP